MLSQKTSNFLIVISTTFVLGCILGSSITSGTPSKSIDSGTYNALSVKKAFDPYTGEPEYWIIAESIEEKELADGVDKTVESHQGDYKFYQVPRTKIVNLPNDSIADPNFSFSGKITVK